MRWLYCVCYISIGCSLLHSQKTEDETNAPKSPESLPLEDCFEMVSQVNWEEDIIWTLDDVKPNLQAQARAGWIPTATTRTAHAYALQQEQLLQQLGINKLNLIFLCLIHVHLVHG